MFFGTKFVIKKIDFIDLKFKLLDYIPILSTIIFIMKNEKWKYLNFESEVKYMQKTNFFNETIMDQMI